MNGKKPSLVRNTNKDAGAIKENGKFKGNFKRT